MQKSKCLCFPISIYFINKMCDSQCIDSEPFPAAKAVEIPGLDFQTSQ